jgi:hypothetical protein
MDDRIQQGRDPEWRLAFEDRLDDAARVRVHRAVRNGDSVGDPDEAAVAAGFARRLAVWAKAGVFEQLHLDVLDRLGLAGRLDWSRASVDSASVRAKRGGTTLAQIRSTGAS